MSATTYGWLVLAFPLAGMLFNALLGRLFPARMAGIVGTLAIALAFAAAVGAFVVLQGEAPADRTHVSALYDYAVTTGVDAKINILIDPLAVYMMLVVSGVSTLIHLYSVGYMHLDAGYRRFFAYLNFFVFSMLLLVEAANFLLLIIGWAFVGAASYMLISFWYRRTTATRAGIKAFVMNVIGDVGLVLGTYFILKHLGTLQFTQVFAGVKDAFPTNDGDLVAACIFFLIGAFAKSAQIPLHTWLPDAMEGPTPVSALIHAATMVTAGVYLIARLWPLFEQAPAAANVGAVVGFVTLMMAATIALTQVDVKRVIAYSTMSQIGYMIMGVSIGGYSAGLFHLMTHAFFKALLFMSAGSLIGAMAGEQSLDKMSGFRKALPFTFGCFVVGGLALSAVPPFSGYFSKDEILLFAGERGGWYWVLWAGGYLAALVTAIYTFRLIFRAFYGQPCDEAVELEQGHQHHAAAPFNPATHETEDTDVGFPGPTHAIAEKALPMKVAMSVLAFLATTAGVLQIPGVTDAVHNWLAPTFAGSQLYDLPTNNTIQDVGLVLGAVLGLLGIGIAYRIWLLRPGTSERIRQRLMPVYTLFVNKYFFDELYDAVFVRSGAAVGRFAQQTFERVVINGVLVGGTTGIVRAGSAAVRALQDGYLRAYAALIVLGVAGVALYLLLQST